MHNTQTRQCSAAENQAVGTSLNELSCLSSVWVYVHIMQTEGTVTAWLARLRKRSCFPGPRFKSGPESFHPRLLIFCSGTFSRDKRSEAAKWWLDLRIIRQ